MILLLLACGEPDACDAMCEVAREKFGTCLEESGLEWGEGAGYSDPLDYDNWCATWTWEARQLGVAGTCEDKLAVFRDGTCDEYRAAWVSE